MSQARCSEVYLTHYLTTKFTNTTQLGQTRLSRQFIHFSLLWCASLKSRWKHRRSSTVLLVGGFPILGTCRTCHICPHLLKKLSGWLLTSTKDQNLRYWILHPLFRWQPVSPLGNFTLMLCNTSKFWLVIGLPHRSTADDVYEGYYIPNGSFMIFNVWYERRFIITRHTSSWRYIC